MEKDEGDGFTPEYDPNETILKSRILEDAFVDIEFQSGQGNNSIDNSYSPSSEIMVNPAIKEKDPQEKPSQKLLNDIGIWGQSCVHIDLKNEFISHATIEIMDLNRSGLKGVGCDFIVKQNGEIIRLIEVKTTVEKFGQMLSISGTQWEVARNFFNEKNGDKYWIYCVLNAGQQNPEIVKIQNPLEKWKDGKLFAHPINFIIK